LVLIKELYYDARSNKSQDSRICFLTLGGKLFVYSVCYAFDCWLILVFCYISFGDLSCHHLV
jgi:hypothetical protein